MRTPLLCFFVALSLGLSAEARRYDIVPPAETALEQAGQGDLEGARAVLQAAVADDADDAEAWSALSLLQDRLGDHRGSQRSARRLAGLLEPRQRKALVERQRLYLAELDQERRAAMGPDEEPGFSVSPDAPHDPLAGKKPTKWDRHGWPTPTPLPSPTATPPPLRLPDLGARAAQEPRVSSPVH
jgi:hypothetical protein